MRKFVHRLRFTGIFLFLVFFTFSSLSAQNESAGFTYQAVARDNSGNPLVDQALTARISIHIESESGELIWQEDHDVQTNTLGLFNLIVGGPDGYAQTGSADSISDIDWAAQQMYMKVWIKTDNNFPKFLPPKRRSLVPFIDFIA